MLKYDIFISYRRREVGDKAEHLKDLLEPFYKNRISFDRENLTGQFNVALIQRIDSVKDFILVLGKDSLVYTDEDRSDAEVKLYNELTDLPLHAFSERMFELENKHPMDWVRIEIGRALKHKNVHIIPVVPEQSDVYNFSSLNLPSDIAAIKSYEAVFYSNSPDSLFKDVVPKIRKHLKSHSGISNRLKYFTILLCSFLAIFLLLLFQKEKKQFYECVTENDFNNLKQNSWFYTNRCVDSLKMFNSLKGRGYSAINDSDNTSNRDSIKVSWSDECSLPQIRVIRKIINNMIYVPHGMFTMGTDNPVGHEIKPHNVLIENDFYVSKFEVTESEWNIVMNNYSELNSNFPKTDISWNDCQIFIQRLRSFTRLDFELPSEAQWEYVASYQNKKGWKYPGSDNPDDVATYSLNSQNKKEEVGKHRPNALEIYDLSGNVSEWCSDGTDKKKRIRGGSYMSDTTGIIITFSDVAKFDTPSSTIGLRLILQ